MKDLSKEKKNNIFKKELIYLFFEENSLESFYKEREYKKIMEDSSRKNEKEKPIDKILCSIKERKFDTEKIKKDLGIDIAVQKYYSQKSAIIGFEGKDYIIKPESRNISFNDGQKSIIKFVCNHKHLKEILNELHFKAFNTTIDEEKESIDSLVSENDEMEIFNIFLDVNIVNIYKDKPNLKN